MNPRAIVFFVLIGLHYGESKGTYKAAVVEYHPIKPGGGLTIVERIEENVKQYVNILEGIQQDLDIIVFPESTLHFGSIAFTRKQLLSSTTLVEIDQIPCKSKGQETWFSQLSCAAILYQTYLSVDVVERSVCEGDVCASDKWNIYNTNVVFDRNGRIVARYRKFNLFGEFNMNVTETAMLTKFKADFGVEFGMFICFDIMFEEPTMKLVQEGVKHFLFPTMWFSQLPFLTAVQTQQMFAYGNDVVVLSAGANYPKVGSGGSGIYQGRSGTLVSYINSTEGSKVLIADVQKTWNNKVIKNLDETNKNLTEEENEAFADGYYLKKEDLRNYTILSYDKNIRTYSITLDKFRCDFNISSKSLSKLPNKSSYIYNMIGYSGIRSFDGVAEGEIQVCALVACVGKTQNTCTTRITSDKVNYLLEFQEVSVRMTLENEGNSKQYPNSVTGALKPLDFDEFTWKEEIVGGRRFRENVLLKPRKNLLAFGIFGRRFP